MRAVAPAYPIVVTLVDSKAPVIPVTASMSPETDWQYEMIVPIIYWQNSPEVVATAHSMQPLAPISP